MNNTSQSQSVLKLENVVRSFTQGGQTLDILRGVNVDLRRGEIVALLGPSGSGKTTMLQIAGLLEPPTSGKVFVGGIAATDTSDEARTTMRRDQIGFVYQFHHLLPDFTALENLMLPQYIAGKDKAAARERAQHLLSLVGLEKRMGHFPSQLSGGEQQRVAIARGLVNHPALLLADEPTGNLDPKTADEVFGILVQTIRSENIGALVVTHNHDLAARMDRVLELKDGCV
ncbi:MAG: ABC transporter ATP-binding protein [Alphaproteobacteria bacterium]|nr:ABC transporter ATP-binding protein [Alphaproteobacteria bacterium]HRI76323.1 ABC transporter ATP-binding protein [Alphaproteobacteria bacterium]